MRNVQNMYAKGRKKKRNARKDYIDRGNVYATRDQKREPLSMSSDMICLGYQVLLSACMSSLMRDIDSTVYIIRLQR